jgi:hypothetical protein
MRALNNSTIAGFAPRATDHSSPEYAERVAQPTMSAIDAMPREYRALVNEFGYIDVYRAWRRGITPESIRQRAKDGIFSL